MRLKRVSSETKVEETILMGMTVSTAFLSKIRPVIEEEFFTSTYTQTVCSWILDYFDINFKAPLSTLEQIFESKKDSMGREDILVVNKLLERMNEIYASFDNIDEKFLMQTATPYLEKRELEIKMNKAAGHIAQNELKEAKAILESPTKMEMDAVVPESPTCESVVTETLFAEHNYIFDYGGALGEIVGPLKKKWFVVIQAPMKRGKTQLLYETAFLAASQGLKVYHVSLEMHKYDTSGRFIKRITGCCEEAGQYVIPVFDCKLNQTGECENKHRTSEVPLIGDDGEFPDFSCAESILSNPYTPCTYCRDHRKLGPVYEPAIWYEVYEKGQITDRSNINKVASYHKLFGKNMRFVAYPKFSKSITEIFQEYHLYSMRTGFRADVFIVDYLDITKPTRFHAQSRDVYDEVWKVAAGQADYYDTLLFSGAQGSRASIKKALMEEDDTTEDIRKLAHVDALFAINQTRQEKRKQAMRIGCLVHRHRAFDINKNALCLQQLTLGQVVLDSEEIYVYESDFDSEGEKEKKKKGRKKRDDNQ